MVEGGTVKHKSHKSKSVKCEGGAAKKVHKPKPKSKSHKLEGGVAKKATKAKKPAKKTVKKHKIEGGAISPALLKLAQKMTQNRKAHYASMYKELHKDPKYDNKKLMFFFGLNAKREISGKPTYPYTAAGYHKCIVEHAARLADNEKAAKVRAIRRTAKNEVNKAMIKILTKKKEKGKLDKVEEAELSRLLKK